jgi:hypothetical protein
MTVTFHDVTISVDGESPEQCYARLCEVLSQPRVDFVTDTFSIGDGSGDLRHTDELFPTGRGFKSCRRR